MPARNLCTFLACSMLLLPAIAQELQPPDSQRLEEANRLASQARAAYGEKNFARAAELYVQAYEAGATRAGVAYNAACSLALAGKADEAFKYLSFAVDHGWRDLEHLKSDSDLDSLHDDPRWPALLDKCAAARQAFRTTMTHPELYDELMRRRTIDQQVRTAEPANGWEMMKIDADNTAWMKEVVARHGWPGKSMVGPDGADAAWLLVQHADQAHEFQKECLQLLTAAYEKGEATGQHVAYLTDRVLVAEGKPQLYGTQFHTVDGKLVPQAIENEAEVDQRRAKMGLGTLADYKAQMTSVYGK